MLYIVKSAIFDSKLPVEILSKILVFCSPCYEFRGYRAIYRSMNREPLTVYFIFAGSSMFNQSILCFKVVGLQSSTTDIKKVDNG